MFALKDEVTKTLAPGLLTACLSCICLRRLHEFLQGRQPFEIDRQQLHQYGEILRLTIVDFQLFLETEGVRYDQGEIDAVREIIYNHEALRDVLHDWRLNLERRIQVQQLEDLNQYAPVSTISPMPANLFDASVLLGNPRSFDEWDAAYTLVDMKNSGA